MKKFLLCGMTLLLLTACGNAENATPETTDTNVAEDTNVETASTEPATPEADVPEAGTELSQLEGLIDSMTGWTSYQSITSVIESYENGEYPDSEVNIDKQYVIEPARLALVIHSWSSTQAMIMQMVALNRWTAVNFMIWKRNLSILF